VNRPPRILIIDTCYPAFLRSAGYMRQALKHEGFGALRDAFMALRFGTSDAYSHNLRLLGWDAQEIIPNSLLLQSAWAQEHDIAFSSRLARNSLSALARLPGFRSNSTSDSSLHHILEAQIEAYSPDVLYFQDLNFVPPETLARFRTYANVIAGQIASPLPTTEVLHSYDIIFSSLPNQVAHIESLGIPAEFLAIGFDTRVLKEVAAKGRDLPLTFVGGISEHHSTTERLLRTANLHCPPISIFGYGRRQLSRDLRGRHFGERWGTDMYRVLLRSQITLNRHIDVAEGYSNNMRLFEATGCGALLVTDNGKNLRDYFSSYEVLSYSDPEAIASLICWARQEPEQAKAMAERAQQRTLTEHSYLRRMGDLDEALRRYLGRRTA